MSSARRFPPPWIVEEHNNACFIVRDSTGQALGYFYFEDEPGRRSADVRFKATAVIGCVSSETARSRMLRVSDAGPSRRCGLHRGRRPKAFNERNRDGRRLSMRLALWGFERRG